MRTGLGAGPLFPKGRNYAVKAVKAVKIMIQRKNTN